MHSDRYHLKMERYGANSIYKDTHKTSEYALPSPMTCKIVAPWCVSLFERTTQKPTRLKKSKQSQC